MREGEESVEADRESAGPAVCCHLTRLAGAARCVQSEAAACVMARTTRVCWAERVTGDCPRRLGAEKKREERKRQHVRESREVRVWQREHSRISMRNGCSAVPRCACRMVCLCACISVSLQHSKSELRAIVEHSSAGSIRECTHACVCVCICLRVYLIEGSA